MSPRVRGALAGVVGLVGGVYFAVRLPGAARSAALIPPAALLVAALTAPATSLGPQLLARGLWWSNLVLGALLTVFGGGSERIIGPVLMLSCAAALLVADRRALAAAAARQGFRPAGYMGTLQLLMVLALADAQTLGLFAVVELGHNDRTAALFAACALGFAAGFVGLLRLAAWGVGLTMSAALALLAAVATRAARIDGDLRPALLALAALQLAAPLPMLASMGLKRPLPASSRRAQAWLARGVIVAVVVAALLARAWHVRPD